LNKHVSREKAALKIKTLAATHRGEGTAKPGVVRLKAHLVGEVEVLSKST
jgi:hypothetical protein